MRFLSKFTATIPTQPDELLAIFVSEGTAGFAGGLASRLVASLIGDKKRDGNFLKGTTSGAYFGVRGAVKSLSAFLGLSIPVATLLADVAASIFAEGTKAFGRKSFNEWESSTQFTLLEPPWKLPLPPNLYW